ncbi:MAG: PIN domain-containing protein [Panacagrimonas sp.]
MKLALDSSVLVAALIEGEAHHAACAAMLRRRAMFAWSHLLAETFSSLTGGRLEEQVSPSVAGRLLEQSIAPRLRWVDLSGAEMASAIGAAHGAGVRGGAIYDFLHLVAARKAGADALYTLNLRHFRALARAGDPEILMPEL